MFHATGAGSGFKSTEESAPLETATWPNSTCLLVQSLTAIVTVFAGLVSDGQDRGNIGSSTRIHWSAGPTGTVTALAGTPLMVRTTGSAAFVRARPGTTTLS